MKNYYITYHCPEFKHEKIVGFYSSLKEAQNAVKDCKISHVQARDFEIWKLTESKPVMKL